jgi:probable HAF family extracellular repeat protein
VKPRAKRRAERWGVVLAAVLLMGCRGGDGPEAAFLWTATGGMVDLGTLGGTESVAVAVNRHGLVIGQSTTRTGDKHAFVWTAAGGMADLRTLGGTESNAVDVNERGQVVGQSTPKDGSKPHAVMWLLTAVRSDR